MHRYPPIRRALVAAAGLALGLTALSEQAEAISRYTSTAMKCTAIKSTLRAEGAALLRWRSSRTGNLLYGRYVANRGYCSVNEVTQVKYVPASDTKNCAVLKCVRRSTVFDDDDWFLFRRR